MVVRGSPEKAMTPHSSPLAWKIPWTKEHGGLQSMGSRRVGHDWATSLSLFTFVHWRRKWQPTLVFLPGESQGRGSLGGLPSLGLHRVGHDWSDLAAAADEVLLWVFWISGFQSAEWSDNEFLLPQARRCGVLFWQLNKLMQSPHDFK